MNRRLALAMRRRMTRVQRRFDVVDLGDGRVRLTCRTCGTVTIERPGEAQARKSGGEISDAAAKHLAHWWAGPTQNGVSGNCDHCLRAERDARWPLGGGA
jgi:hypothetical protein